MGYAQQVLDGDAGGDRRAFLVARNPDPGSSLPYLLEIPAGGGLTLAARESWPTSSRVYCHRHDGPIPGHAEVLETVAVRMCMWRGAAVDLVLDRHRHNRSQFVFTKARGRPAIFWQTPAVARKARPRLRLPAHKGSARLTIEVDARERRPYRFATPAVEVVSGTLFAGDYAVRGQSGVIAAVERKTLDDLVHSLANGSLGFAMADLSALATAAVVVEDRLSALATCPRVNASALLDVLARLQVRYPSVPIVFAETRKLAEHWTHRFLAAARAEYGEAAGASEP